MLRGAQISDDEREGLNLEARRLFESHRVRMNYLNDYDKMRESNHAGYASYYLFKCWDKSELKNKADVTTYKKLLEIDAKLGTTQTEQLRWCLAYSPRQDLIEV